MSEHPDKPGVTVDDGAPFCGQCGRAVSGDHLGCRQRAEWEPPRYCPWCARRMVVQVDPSGWRARCSRHSELRG